MTFFVYICLLHTSLDVTKRKVLALSIFVVFFVVFLNFLLLN
jgi:hypothetical protein